MNRTAKTLGILATTLVGPILVAVGAVQVNNAQIDAARASGNEGALPIIAGLVVVIIGVSLWVVNRKA